MPGVPPARFAYLGPAGTFTESALRQIPAAKTGEQIPYNSVLAALDAVRDGDADGAVVPIENSVEGVVPVTVDYLFTGDPLMITREMHVTVDFALLARPGTSIEDVRKVATHPHGEAQMPTLDRRQPAEGRGRARGLDGARRGDGGAEGRALRRGDRGAGRGRDVSARRRWPPASAIGSVR